MFVKFSHVGIVVHDIEKTKELWYKTYGLKATHTRVVPEEGIKNAMLPIGTNAIELIEPIDHSDMNNAVARRLAERGEGIYHLAIFVDDIFKEGEGLSEKGVRLIKRDATSSTQAIRWVVHPKDASGVLLELMQTSPEVEQKGIAYLMNQTKS